MSELPQTEDDMIDAYYKAHRGGSGNVMVVTMFPPDGSEILGVFSCIETAQAWVDGFPDDHVSVFCPYVVDNPDFGNKELH